jgi:hypothetical protein
MGDNWFLSFVSLYFGLGRAVQVPDGYVSE